jgi:hypothetical protein
LIAVDMREERTMPQALDPVTEHHLRKVTDGLVDRRKEPS